MESNGPYGSLKVLRGPMDPYRSLKVVMLPNAFL